MAGGGPQRTGISAATRPIARPCLRNLVTSLIRDESIQTTWPKAKEAQRMAEKLITLAKKNNETSRRKIQGMLFVELMPKVLGELRERYADRAGGCTRVLRTEPKDTYSQAPSAILELVDGPKDMRFAVTAAAVARDRRMGVEHSRLTLKNVDKVTRYRPGGKQALEDMVKRVSKLAL